MCLRPSVEKDPNGVDSKPAEPVQRLSAGDEPREPIVPGSGVAACSTEVSAGGSSDDAAAFASKLEKPEATNSGWRRRLKFVGAILVAIPLFVLFSLFYRGSLLLLEYRKFFGNRAPITLSPIHGVVSAFVSSTEQAPSCASEMLFHDLEYQFKTYHSDLPSEASEKPLRILIVGDSTARGVGIQESCHPIMPEVLATVLSRHFSGRPVYWSAVGEPGATIKMIAQQIEKTKRTSDSPSMEEFHGLHGTAAFDSAYNREPESNATTTSCWADENGYTPDQQQWVERLEYHEKLYHANEFSGYDYIVALSGVNEVKRIIIPFLVQESDGFDALPTNGLSSERGFKADLNLFIHKLKEVANDHRAGQDDEGTIFAGTVPHIIFPGMPVKHAPARMGSVLRWIGIQSCKILDDLKKVAEAEDPEHVFAAPIVSDQDTLDFIQHKGILADAINAEEDVKLRLVHVNGKVCRDLITDMTTFYSENQASVEPGKNMLELFSPDAVHPNDFGYDYFGRYLGLMIIEKWLTNGKED